MSAVNQQFWTVMVRPPGNSGFPLLLPVSDAAAFTQNKMPFVHAKGSEAIVREYFERLHPNMDVQLTPAPALPFYDLSQVPTTVTKQ